MTRVLMPDGTFCWLCRGLDLIRGVGAQYVENASRCGQVEPACVTDRRRRGVGAHYIDTIDEDCR
jgi:hypothetical protein